MESELLEKINEEISKIVTYEYGEYTGKLVYPYAVGEYSEGSYSYEDNGTTGSFILTLFNRGNELELIDIKEKIKKVFADYRANTESGTIYVGYRNKLFLRSGEAELKKMEIYLDTMYWEGV